MNTSPIGMPVSDDPLVPVSARFPLSRTGLPASGEAPSGAERPFALRFVRQPERLVYALPPHRYCPIRQVMVTDDDLAQPVLAFTPTTVGTKDGKGNPQEDWKPDLPFHDDL